MSQQHRRFRLGVDIGGTFVDVALQDTQDGSIRVGKYLSDPFDPAKSALDAIAGVLGAHGLSLDSLQQVVHATTIGANTIIQRNGARAAFLVTQGFGDILEIQRQLRHSPYDLHFHRYAPLVPRELVFEVPERLRSTGESYRALDEKAVESIARRLVEQRVTAAAVCFLHSYVSAVHEQRVRELLSEHAPGIVVSLSSDVAPLIREYERASTTVANAYIQRAFHDYLTNMESMLRSGGFAGSFLIMQANGGLATPEQTKHIPIRAVESGPAAGAILAAAHGLDSGATRVLSFDMGGTTAKAATAIDGEVGLVNTFELDKTLMRSGTGIPVLIPSLDLVETGAGGGSIASAKLGVIQVGPHSAGASPGPACYDRGGTDATVSDANLILGYLDPDYFNGGELQLVPGHSARAIDTHVAQPLGLSLDEAAWGIHDAVTSNMADTIRAVSLERGHDPRNFTLVAFGGSGPLHAARIARSLHIPTVIVPASAGVMSAVGLLTADARFDLSRSLVAKMDQDAIEAIDSAVDELAVEARELVEMTHLRGTRSYRTIVEMCYVGQGHEVEVPLPDDNGGDRVAELVRSFEKTYAQRYGYSDSQSMAQMTSVRLTATIELPKNVKQRTDGNHADLGTPTPRSTEAYFPELPGRSRCPVYRRDQLPPTHQLTGPAIIQEQECTTVVLPGDQLLVDTHGNLVITIGDTA